VKVNVGWFLSDLAGNRYRQLKIHGSRSSDTNHTKRQRPIPIRNQGKNHQRTITNFARHGASFE